MWVLVDANLLNSLTKSVISVISYVNLRVKQEFLAAQRGRQARGWWLTLRSVSYSLATGIEYSTLMSERRRGLFWFVLTAHGQLWWRGLSRRHCSSHSSQDVAITQSPEDQNPPFQLASPEVTSNQAPLPNVTLSYCVSQQMSPRRSTAPPWPNLCWEFGSIL